MYLNYKQHGTVTVVTMFLGSTAIAARSRLLVADEVHVYLRAGVSSISFR